MMRLMARGAVLVTALVLLFAWSGSAAARRALIPLKVRTAPFLSFSVLYIGKAEGHFEREGLDVELVEMTGTSPLVPALVQGEIDVLPAALSPGLLNAIARGARIRSVASLTQILPASTCSYIGLLASPSLVKSGALQQPVTLGGRRMNGSRSFPAAFFADTALTVAGVSPSALELVEVPDQVAGEALKAGRLDLAVLAEPWVSRVVASGDGVMWKRIEQVSPGLQFSVIFYGPRLLDRDPELGRRFMRGYLAAVRQYNRGKTDRNVAILAQATGADAASVRAMCWPDVNGDGTVMTRSVLEFQSWAMKNKLVDKPLTAEQVHDGRFVQ